MTLTREAAAGRLASLGLVVFERGWLSANNVLHLPADGGPATVIDTGYVLHAGQTVDLVRARLGGRPLGRIVNTHLHSDHCGGNARLQSTFGCEAWVPEPSFDAVRMWDASRLSYERTDQRCDRFRADRAVRPGQTILLGEFRWLAFATPGHDPDALVFFQPEARVLIAGDALWQDRLAIVFPALYGVPSDSGEDPFAPVARTLDLIEALEPDIVVPGHGPPFTDAAAALAVSRERLSSFATAPDRHRDHALRVMAMFHMLEKREREYSELAAWMASTPLLRHALLASGLGEDQIPQHVEETIERLLRDRALERRGSMVISRTDDRG
jgi:glyoxylase-like metal-dependent hydrolase (beta-lactamase superfamily II)